MEILLERKYKKEKYTIGSISINGEFVCNSLEDHDYGWTQSTSIEEIKTIKRQHPQQTAIPSGRYQIKCEIYCGMADRFPFYKRSSCEGKIPRLYKVPGFSGILIHCGSTAENSAGCILVGKNTKPGILTESKLCFTKICNLIVDAIKRGEKVWIHIK